MEIRHRHGRTGASERLRDRTTDSGARASHKSYGPVEPECGRIEHDSFPSPERFSR
jgi:hypothetical protein